MPIIKSAKKALRQSKKRHVQNLRRKRAVLKVTKEIKKAALNKDKKKAVSLLPTAYKAIDKARKAGVIKKNTAARKKSQLARLVK